MSLVVVVVEVMMMVVWFGLVGCDVSIGSLIDSWLDCAQLGGN
jgi:hypothetical protein